MGSRSRISTADFGSMANPLAQNARRASKAEFSAAVGAAVRPGETTNGNYSRPGRAERPRWNTPDQAVAPAQASGEGKQTMARWQPPAPAPAATPATNGHGPSGIQPARRPESNGHAGTTEKAAPRERVAPGYADDSVVASNGFSTQEAATGFTGQSELPSRFEPGQGKGRSPQGAWAAGLVDDSWDGEEDDDSFEDRVPRVLVLDRVGKFSTDLAKATVDLDPAPEILRLSRSTQVIEVVEQEEPDVIVVAPEEVSGAGLKRLAEIHRNDPKIVIVLTEGTKPVTAAQTAACGTSDIIPKGVTKARLRSRIVRAIETAEELRQEHRVISERVVIQEAPARELEPEVPAEVKAPAPFAPKPPGARSTKLARVFTVASASGGCGKTFYSTNFAAYLAKATGGKVLLVDLDLQFGEVAISLHLRPKRTIAELVQEDDIAAALGDYLIDHSAGYKVLCAPRDPVAGDRVGPRETTAVLEAARQQFDYIVVDTPPSLNETCLAAFDQSQSLVIMATMDLPSLKNLRVFLETLKKLNLPADQVSLVVNKAESGTGIDLREVEPLYPQGFSAVLPYAKQVSWSINMGMPVLVADPNADISRKLFEGAVKLVPPSAGKQLPWSAPAAAPRRGWFSRLLKGKAK